MTYEINFDRAAIKAQKRIDAKALAVILAAIETLAEDPRPHNSRVLAGPLSGQYRLRVGAHYRVLYTIDDKAHEVTIKNLGSRESIY